MNEVILTGRLTKKPEFYPSQNENSKARARFTLAVDRNFSQGGERKADFISIVVFGKQAEICDQYLDKGRQVGVVGSIQTGSYTNKEGVTVYTTDVVCSRIEFLGGKNSSQDTSSAAKSSISESAGNEHISEGFEFGEVDDEDMPF